MQWKKNLMLWNLLKKIREEKSEKFQEISGKINDCLDPRKTKMIVEINDHESAAIKSFAVKKEVASK